MKKRFFSDLTLLAIAAIATTSCQDDITGGKHNTTYPENVIAFTIDGNKTLAGTRADVKHTIVAPSNVVDLPFEEGMPSLCLVETVTSLDDTYYDAVAGTRGTPVYTENFGDVYGGFYGRAYLMPQGTTTTGSTEGGSAPAYDDADLFLSPAWFAKEGEGNYYVHDYSDLGLRWPSNHELYFFLETKRADEPVNNLKYNQDGSFSFDYTSPCSTPDQEDILFTSKVMKMESKDEENTLLFYHPLTGVKFKLGVLSEDNYGVKVDVTAIWMDGIAESGHCILKPNYVSGVNTSAGNKSNKKNDTNADTKSAACAKWTVDEDSRTLFVYAPDGTTVNGDEAAYEFPKSFYTQTEGAFGTTADYNLNDAEYSQTFWFIPQTVKPEEETNVIIDYTVTFPDGSTADGTSYIALNTTWNAGELHTYTLAFRQVHVSIDDKVNGNVKSDLTTPNTGNVTEYQRVVLTANWVFHDEIYGEGDVIMEPYDLTTEEARSHFEGLLGNGMWVEGADGFFYYKNPIEPGKTPKVPLFTKFTAPEPTIKGTHLEMSISVQAVKFDTKKEIFDNYWENPVQKGTTSTKVSAWISTTPEE